MNNKWFGEFRTLERSSLLSIQYWKWCFLNIWCLIDVLLFPVLFVLFYIIHICRNKARKKRGNLLKRVVFIFRLLISSVRVINPQFSICLMEILLMIRFLRHSRSLRKLREISPKLPLMFISVLFWINWGMKVTARHITFKFWAHFPDLILDDHRELPNIKAYLSLYEFVNPICCQT